MPNTGSCMVAAYIVTAVVIGIYVVSLWRRGNSKG